VHTNLDARLAARLADVLFVRPAFRLVLLVIKLFQISGRFRHVLSFGNLVPVSRCLIVLGYPATKIIHWLITEGDDARLKIQNVRTGHETVLAKDRIRYYTSNPHRVTNGREHGFLALLVQIYIQNDRITIKPSLRPGEFFGSPAGPEIVDEWVDLMYPIFSVAQKLGIDSNTLAWVGESNTIGTPSPHSLQKTFAFG
jgi:hypothetical protein